MEKTIVILPDGTEISSGDGNVTAVVSCKITESVNSGEELNPGSACSAMAEILLIGTGGNVSAGQEITIYRENGTRTKQGVFMIESLKKKSRSRIEITAYDAVSKLDQDVSGWLNSLTGWPYDLLTFGRMVCSRCGLTLINTSIPNGSHPVQKFGAERVTGRQLMYWVGQAACRFCRATADGEILLDWYTPSGTDMGPTRFPHKVLTEYSDGEYILEAPDIPAVFSGGELKLTSSVLVPAYAGKELSVTLNAGAERVPYFIGTLNRQEHPVQKIDKVQIQTGEDDIGTIYPDSAGTNTYRITGNLLLTAESADSLRPVAQVIYNALKEFTYTPCTLEVPENSAIRAGHVVNVTDTDGNTVQTVIMKRVLSGDKNVLESTGSRTRDSVTAVNNQEYKALSCKFMNIKADVDGLSVHVEQVSQKAEDDLKNFSDSVTNEIDGIKNQLDGVIDTWYGEEVPTENNKPAVDWATPQDKEKHSSDLYYVVGSGPNSGEAYRWITLNGRWYWDKLANSDIAKALEAAAKAQDTADHKRRVFVATPYTPYDEGDLWAQGTSGELMRCNVSRQSGAYQASDWGPASDTGRKFTEFQQTANEITASVTSLSSSVDSRFNQTANEISAKVSHSGGDSASFGWYLNTGGFFIDANGSTIISATQNGLRVEGQIEALSGHIGNWDIGADGTINAKSSDGLYTFIAPPGTAGMGGNVILAGGSGETAYPFKVGSDGSLVATKATITGDIYGNNGYFHGTVRAGKIEYSGEAGYFSGAGLSGTSVSNGKLSTTVSDNIAKGVAASDITSGRVSAIRMISNDFKTSTLHIGSHLVLRIPIRLRNPATGQIEDYMVLATHGTA